MQQPAALNDDFPACSCPSADLLFGANDKGMYSHCLWQCFLHSVTVLQAVLKFGLARGRHILVERSCQNALIYLIRRARYFLMVESQYFEGASAVCSAAGGPT